MANIEEELKIRKIEIDSIKVPEELEDRLRSALTHAPEQKSKRALKGLWFMRHRALAAVLALIAFLGIYNYDVFAYYGKKILGYDEITFGSINELNELGMGQEINKSYRFKNGTEITLDGVMLDENKLVAMYTVRGESEDKIDKLNLGPLTGSFGRYYPSGGHGKMSDDRKEIKWVQEFKTPSAFDRNLTFNMTSYADDISKNETGSIKFKLDLNKAIKRIMKSNINQAVEFEGTKYKFTTISATPMSVAIEGNIEISSEEILKLFTGQDMWSPRRNLHVELVETYLEGGRLITEKLQGTGGSMGTGTGGIQFKYEFEGLENGVKQLSLNVVKVEDMRIIDKNIDVNKETRNLRVVPETDELIIKDVKIENGNTAVTFSGQSDVAFVTALMIGGNQAKVLSESTRNIQVNGEARIEKTMTFEGSGSDMKQMFKTISHESYINKDITIYQSK